MNDDKKHNENLNLAERGSSPIPVMGYLHYLNPKTEENYTPKQKEESKKERDKHKKEIDETLKEENRRKARHIDQRKKKVDEDPKRLKGNEEMSEGLIFPPEEGYKESTTFGGKKKKCHTKKCKRKNKKSKKRMNGGGGSQSRPTVEEDTTPRAEVVKQLKYKFNYDNDNWILKDNTADLEHKTPQLGNAEGKGEYIIDLVYDQESEGFNDYRDAKSRIFDVIATQEKKIEELEKKIRDKRNELTQLFRIMTPDQKLKNIAEINKIEKEKDVINERLDHLDAIESYLLSYSTDVHHIPQEGKITELGKRRTSARFLPVAYMRGGKRKTRKKFRKIKKEKNT